MLKYIVSVWKLELCLKLKSNWNLRIGNGKIKEKKNTNLLMGQIELSRPSLPTPLTPARPILAPLWIMSSAWWDPRANVPTIVGADPSIWRVGPKFQLYPPSRVVATNSLRPQVQTYLLPSAVWCRYLGRISRAALKSALVLNLWLFIGPRSSRCLSGRKIIPARPMAIDWGARHQWRSQDLSKCRAEYDTKNLY
jgi:hypothetical protein